MKKAIIITARINSTRLYKKILAKINHKNLSIDILIKRAKKTNYPIIIATSSKISDIELVNYVKNKYKDVRIFRGNHDNKIKRWHSCFKKFKLDYAGFVDGDDLAFDYDIYKNQLDKLKKGKSCLIKFPKNIVTGIFTYIINKKDIFKIYQKTKHLKKIDVFEYYLKYVKNIKILKLSKNLTNKKIRLTLDYKDDLVFFKKLFGKINIEDKSSNIIKYLNSNITLPKLNYHLEKKWKENQLIEIKKYK